MASFARLHHPHIAGLLGHTISREFIIVTTFVELKNQSVCNGLLWQAGEWVIAKKQLADWKEKVMGVI